MKSFEILEVENGFIVLEGAWAGHGGPFPGDRKKWVAKDHRELSELIFRLTESDKPE